MKQILAYIGSHHHVTVNLLVDGEHRVLVIPNDHQNINEIKKAIEDGDAEQLYNLYDVTHQIATYTEGAVTIEGNTLIWSGMEISSKLVTRILKLREEGSKFDYLVKFLERLLENPSKRAVDELYTFLEHKDLPITVDGYFLAYKAVRSNFTDKFSGKFDNSIGSKPKMPRNRVCDNKSEGCSKGFHAGTLEYVRDFGRSGDKYVIVKIDPADVVSIPTDWNCQKLRCCTYEVIGEYTEPLTRSVYNNDGSELDEDEDEDDLDLDLEDEEDFDFIDDEDDEDEDEDVNHELMAEIEKFIDDNIGSRVISLTVLSAMFEGYASEEIEETLDASSKYKIEDDYVSYR